MQPHVQKYRKHARTLSAHSLSQNPHHLEHTAIYCYYKVDTVRGYCSICRDVLQLRATLRAPGTLELES